ASASLPELVPALSGAVPSRTPTARLTWCNQATWPIQPMPPDRPLAALAVTGHADPWRMMLMDVPSPGAGRVSSVHKRASSTPINAWRTHGVRRAFYFPSVADAEAPA